METACWPPHQGLIQSGRAAPERLGANKAQVTPLLPARGPHSETAALGPKHVFLSSVLGLLLASPCPAVWEHGRAGPAPSSHGRAEADGP